MWTVFGPKTEVTAEEKKDNSLTEVKTQKLKNGITGVLRHTQEYFYLYMYDDSKQTAAIMEFKTSALEYDVECKANK